MPTFKRNLATGASEAACAENRASFTEATLRFWSAETAAAIPTEWSFVLPSAPTATAVRNPVVIFEVLSPSTAAKDRIVKAREYQATPSVQRYVMLEQARDRRDRPTSAPRTDGAPLSSRTTTPSSCPKSASQFRSPNSTKA